VLPSARRRPSPAADAAERRGPPATHQSTGVTQRVTDPPPIRTPRLALVPIPPEAIERLVDGDRQGAETALGGIALPDEFPSRDELHGFLRVQLERMRREPTRREWMARLMIDEEAAGARRATKAVIGHCGFHGPPQTIGRAEIGYTVFERHRNKGYAREAAHALVKWAFANGEREVYATVAPDNAPSLAVVRAVGFIQVGTQVDEVDGLELVFVLRREPSPPDAPAV